MTRWKFQRDAAAREAARKSRQATAKTRANRAQAMRLARGARMRDVQANSLEIQVEALALVAPSTRVDCPWRLERPGPCPLGDRCFCGGIGWVTAGWLSAHFARTIASIRGEQRGAGRLPPGEKG